MSNRLSPPVQRAVRRSRWLAELAEALDQASELALALRDRGQDHSEADMLRAKIHALRAQVAAERSGRRLDTDRIHPNWTG